MSWKEARDQDSYHSQAGNDRSTAVVVQSSGSAKTLVENQFSLFFFKLFPSSRSGQSEIKIPSLFCKVTPRGFMHG